MDMIPIPNPADLDVAIGATGSEAISTQLTEEWCKLHRLIDELTELQHRLGTPLERPDDLVAIRELGHAIRNKLFRLQIWAESGMVSLDVPAA